MLPGNIQSQRLSVLQPHASLEPQPGPSRLILSQIRALLAAPAGFGNDALKQIVARYIMKGEQQGPEIYRKRGAALIGALLGRPFSPESISNHPTVALRLRLGNAEPIYDLICEQIAGAQSDVQVPSQSCATPAQGIASVPDLVLPRAEPFVVTLLGSVAPKAQAPKSLVAFDCDDVGTYNQRQWRSVSPALRTISSLLHDAPTAQHMLRVLLASPTDGQLPLAQAYACMSIGDTLAYPAQAPIIEAAANVPPQLMSKFAKMCSTALSRRNDLPDTSAAIAALAKIPESLLSLALHSDESEVHYAEWLVASIKELLSAPAGNRDSILRCMLTLKSIAGPDIANVSAWSRSLMAIDPDLREGASHLIALLLGDKKSTDTTAMLEILASAHPGTLASVLDNLDAIKALNAGANGHGSRGEAAFAVIFSLPPLLVCKILEQCDSSNAAWYLTVLGEVASMPSSDALHSTLDAIFSLGPAALSRTSFDHGHVATALGDFGSDEHFSLFRAAVAMELKSPSAAVLKKIFTALALLDVADRCDIARVLKASCASTLPQQELCTLVMYLSPLSPRNRETFFSAIADSILLKPNFFKTKALDRMFDGLYACKTEEGAQRIKVSLRLIGGCWHESVVEDAVEAAMTLPPERLNMYDSLIPYIGSSNRLVIVGLLARMEARERAHIVSCFEDLAAIDAAIDAPLGGLKWAEAALSELVESKSVMDRTALVTHLVDLRIGSLTSPDTFRSCSRLLSGLHPKRSMVLRCAKAILSPAILAPYRGELFDTICAIPTEDLANFLAYCRAQGLTVSESPNKMDRFRTLYHQFQQGARADLLYGGDVHNGELSARLVTQITTLKREGPQIAPGRLQAVFRAIRSAIDAAERQTPRKHPDRNKREGRTWTMFDEARHTLFGPVRGYANIEGNHESFNLSDGAIGLGDLAALIWESIEQYPRLAVPGAKTDAATVARDKAGLRLAFIRALASCVDEHNYRVCYAGKAARIMVPLEGWLQLLPIHQQGDVPGVQPPAAGDLLSELSKETFGEEDEPALVVIEAFVGKALALAESAWDDSHSEEHARFIKNLSDYVTGFYEEFNAAHPNFWRSYRARAGDN